jgi:cell division protein FtsB
VARPGPTSPYPPGVPSRSPSHLVRLATAAVLATGLGACAASGTAEEVAALQAELEARASDQEALVARVAALEEELSALADDPALDRAEQRLTGRTDDLEGQLADLAAQVAALEDRVGQEAEARAALGDELETATADLRGGLADVRQALDQLAGETEELRTLYLVLRDRLDRLGR